MASTFPTTLDVLSNPAGTDTMAVHADQHINVNDAIEAIEARLGVTGTAVAGTVEKRLVDAITTASAATSAVAGAVAGRTIAAADAALLTDNGVLITVTAAAALTVPADASVAWPANAMLSMYQASAGAATFVAGAGVTLRSPTGIAAGTQYGIVAAMRVAANEWTLI